MCGCNAVLLKMTCALLPVLLRLLRNFNKLQDTGCKLLELAIKHSLQLSPLTFATSCRYRMPSGEGPRMS